MATTCQLCRRRFPDELLTDPQAIQRHHLVPENRKESPTVTLCRPCHAQVHATFTNEELREDYDTLDALRDARPLQGYLNWIRKTAKLDVQTQTSNRVRERR
ncbi:hypothetical protein [Halomarina litorea]|uniref:hypothetical protein n=1 Tax=Halomarina litorea TaxID=2961595 RepID=UPI0020C31EAF|nr:hypothetical protein [Halomarina sp. BCD28]